MTLKSPTLLASLLLDRSCPRPANLQVAGTWWEQTLDQLQNGQIIPEALWNTEEDLPARWDEGEGKQIFHEALKHLPETRPQLGGPDDERKLETFVMGHVMQELRGRIPGRHVRQWVAETIQEWIKEGRQ